jgi:hypothetical protein
MEVMPVPVVGWTRAPPRSQADGAMRVKSLTIVDIPKSTCHRARWVEVHPGSQICLEGERYLD